jgi:hypothetical protein
MVTDNPLDWSSLPRDALIITLPSEEVTPPVTKMYLTIEWIMMLRDAKLNEKG